MTDDISKPRDSFPRFLAFACVALAVLTLLLAWQNRSLKLQLAAAQGALPASALKTGDLLGPLSVVDASGNKSDVAFDGGGETLLLVFSSTCGACRETIPQWNKLLAEGVPSAIRVVGIQTDMHQGAGAGAAVPIPDLRFPVFATTEAAAESMSKFPVIPVAALIDGKGAVKSVWFGLPTAAQMSELRRALAS